jgi:hypothetical protein
VGYVESVNLHRNKLLENWRLLGKAFLEGVLPNAKKPSLWRKKFWLLLSGKLDRCAVINR